MIWGATKYRASGTPSTVLLHLDGTNGSTTFTDVYSHSFTQVGAAALSTSQFKFGTASLSMGGAADAIQANPTSTEFDLASDFTIEGFVNYNTVAGATAQCFCSRDDGGGSTNKWGLGLNVLTSGDFSLHRNFAGTAHNLEWVWGPSINTWYHVALAFDNTNKVFNLYINGVSLGIFYDTNGMPVPTTNKQLALGYLREGTWWTNGFIDEFRLSPVDRYPIGFVVPSSAFSSGSHLIHFDGANGSTTFTDVGSNAVSVTAGGTGQVETSTVKFGTGALATGTQAGWAILAHSADQEFGSGDFTIECWAYLTSLPSAGQTQATLCAKVPTLSVADAFQWSVLPSGLVQARLSNTTASWVVTVASTVTFSIGTWHHMVLERSGSTVMIFMDGTLIGAQPISISLFSSAASLIKVGTYDDAGDFGWIGFIDEFRISASAVYTGNFTPPAAPFSF